MFSSTIQNLKVLIVVSVVCLVTTIALFFIPEDFRIENFDEHSEWRRNFQKQLTADGNNTKAENCSSDVMALTVPEQIINSTRNAHHDFAPSSILVLGSGGLVGSALVTALKNLSYHVIEVKNRYDIDLRVDASLEPLLDANSVDFCFFLACEVGGSKYLSDAQMQQMSDLYSDRMQQAVISSLSKRQIPFLFASTQLVNNAQHSPYAEVKKRGEILTLNGGGKVFRIWNAYGPEAISFKSHVVSDWIFRCLEDGRVQSTTDGLEARQFMHVDNIAMALVAMMQKFPQLIPVTDLASDNPITMRELASVISSEIPGECNFTFTTNKSFYPSSAMPKNLFKVPGSLRCGIRRLVEYYRGKRGRKESGEVYLSIITGSTNDDYNGIRSRLFTFLHFLGEQLSKTNLLYEVIVVQYNPRITDDYFSGNYDKETARLTDLPISQLFPLTQGIVSLAPLRIVTVPNELHRFGDKGQFWEYIAKNVGAQVAHGNFFLFTNVDNLFPTSLIAWLAKEQLLTNRLYRAGMLQNEFYNQASCDQIGIGHAACRKKGLCLPDFSEKSNSYCDVCLGDFSIFSRESFFETKGYLEFPQSTHLETAHLHYAGELSGFKSIEVVWMDDTLCHRDHQRNDRPAVVTNDLGYLVEKMRERTPNDEWGLASQINKLPEARLSNRSIWEWGFNPETPFLLRRHHPLFEELFHTIALAPFNRDYHLDFSGTRTRYVYDCENWFRYRRYHLSRRLVCDRIDVFNDYQTSGSFKGLDTAFSHVQIYGDLPIIDEEYFEWLSLLRALRAWRNLERPFVVAELGARYGTWAARGASMARRIRPDLGAHVCAIEGDSVGFGWLQEHMRVNGFFQNASLLRGMVGSASSTQSAVQWEPGSSSDTVRVYTVPEILEKYLEVDIVHIDIQGAEICLLNQDVKTFLDERVRFLHIGTHGNQILQDLQDKFLKDSTWTLLHEFKQGTKVVTEMGPITLAADGELAIRNVKLTS